MAPERISSWSIPVLASGAVVALVSTVAVMFGGSAHALRADTIGVPLRIVYFQPAEPEIQPGSVMDVGPVVSGYVHLPHAAVSPTYEETAWLEDEAPYQPETVSPASGRDEVARITFYTSTPEPRRSDLSGSLGFDDPLPAYAEARRQRAVELDRRMSDRRATLDERPSVVGPQPAADYEPDNAFF